MDTLESAIRAIARDEIKKITTNLEKQDIREILTEVMPEIDKMISQRIREHLHALGLFLVDHTGSREDAE